MTSFNQQEKRTRSFTLVEALVSISIIFILTAVILPRYATLRDDFSLLSATYKLSQDIRMTQEMATSTKEYSGQIPLGGYGVYLTESSATSYRIYADTNGNEVYNAGDGIFTTINIVRGVRIQSILPRTSTPNEASINFRPPDPSVKISIPGQADPSPVEITLVLESNPSKTKKVFVNKVGLIYVQ